MPNFINISNHPADRWSEEQLQAAGGLENVRTISFPQVDPTTNEEGIARLTKLMVERVYEALSWPRPEVENGILHAWFLEGITILVQGEARLQTSLVMALKSLHADVVCATSVRDVVETTNPDGTTAKQVTFKFAGFQRYLCMTHAYELWTEE